MASTEAKRRRGTTAQNATFTGALAEIIYSTDDKRIYLHDAATAGGTLVPNAKDVLNQLVSAADIAQAVAATYTVTLAPVPAAYTKYMRVVGVVASASDGNDTLNVNGLGAKTIKKDGGASNLASGDLVANGLYVFDYDGTNFQVSVASSALPAPDFETTGQTVTADTVLAIAHSLGVIPNLVQVVMVCNSAELGYSVNDELHRMDTIGVGTSDSGVTTKADSTNITLIQSAFIHIINQSTLNQGSITVGNWRWTVRAWK